MYKEEYDNIGIIYKYTSPSGKSYIGQTRFPNRRKAQHKLEAKQGSKCTFHKAIRKYGWDSFEYEVLFTVFNDNVNELQDILNEKEIYYIQLYDTFKNGYNDTPGGNQYSGENHPSYGTHLSEEHKEKLKASVCKEVSQYDSDGNYITTYKSAADASQVTGCDRSAITAVCKEKQKSSKGFQWRYGHSQENIGPIPQRKKSSYKTPSGSLNSRSKTVYQYTLVGELVNIWGSALEAEREANYCSTKISKVVKNKCPYGKHKERKYIWSFQQLTSEEVIQIVKEWNDNKSKQSPKNEEKE